MWIRPSQVANVLGWIIAVLVVFSLIGSFSAQILGHGRLLGFVPEFQVDEENNIPTYFASFLLLMASALLVIIAYIQQSSSRSRWHWIGLAVLFLLFSIDETASLHERLVEPLRTFLDAGGLLYYTWVIPAAIFLLLFGLVYIRFWYRLPTPSRWLFALAGLIYVSGALGLELIGGWYMDRYERTFTYELLTTVEEMLEMAGVATFIYALLMHIGRQVSSITFHVVPK